MVGTPQGKGPSSFVLEENIKSDSNPVEVRIHRILKNYDMSYLRMFPGFFMVICDTRGRIPIKKIGFAKVPELEFYRGGAKLASYG